MNPSLQQVERWMAAQHRMARWSPVDTLSARERIDVIATIFDAFASFAAETGFEVKLPSTIVTKDEDNKVNPVTLLAALTHLHAEVIAAAHAYGLAAALSGGVYELTNPACEPGAGPPRHEPNFRVVLEKVYDYSPDEE